MIISPLDFYKTLKSKFPYTPTTVQDDLLHKLSSYIFNKDKNIIFLLKGFAGTGKTTAMSTLVNNLWEVGMKSVLLAPTGRAAKVISNYSNKKAFTIHKKIYHPRKSNNGGVSFTLQQNKHTDTIFVVDEASMIPDNAGNIKFSDQASLLDDLLSYVYAGKNCKIIFVGDTAQLPPVKLELSPALKAETLEINYNKKDLQKNKKLGERWKRKITTQII